MTPEHKEALKLMLMANGHVITDEPEEARKCLVAALDLLGDRSSRVAADRLRRIQDTIDRVENRCLASDGPVPITRYEMTDEELREIYQLARIDSK